MGAGAVAVAVMDVVWPGTKYSGGTVAPGMGTCTAELLRAARAYRVARSSRPSRKYSSGTLPLLVTVTWAVTGVPAASRADAASGRPRAETAGAVRVRVTVNGCERAVPDTWP